MPSILTSNRRVQRFCALKQVDAEDYNSWMKVFPLAQNSLMSLDTNAVFDPSLFHAVLTEKPYLSQSLRVNLSPGRYYDREHKVFQQVIHYMYYFQLVVVQ